MIRRESQSIAILKVNQVVSDSVIDAIADEIAASVRFYVEL